MSWPAGLVLAPPLPPALGLALALALALAAVAGLVRAPRRFWPRALLALAAAVLLAGPAVRQETRAPARPLAIALVDRSASMAVADGRAAQAQAALARLRAAAPEVEWRVVEATQPPGGVTRLAPALEQALGAAPAERLAAVVLLSDGLGTDRAADLAVPAGVPLHALIAGDPARPDRRLTVRRAPPYALVGEVARIELLVEDEPATAAGPVAIAWSLDGRPQPPLAARPGVPLAVSLPVGHRGALVAAFSAAPRAGEVSTLNNQALVRVEGVRERLRVLLVSGAPYPGGRVWRDILKADEAIDLIHFTILRLPSSFDPTPPDDLALIPFPVEELFERRLAGFDLIIFDRFGLSELIDPRHLAAVVARTRAGGGLLVVAGEEFAAPGGLAATPLAAALPAAPAGPPVAAAFRPALTAAGRTHPVTAELPRAHGGEAWGDWGSMAALAPRPDARVLMAGPAGRPLLLLAAEGEGRSAMLASTDLWWWARDVAGPGPREVLLKRLAHWLMREPELEEARLEARVTGRELAIRAGAGVESARITPPAGPAVDVALAPTPDGARTARVRLAADGLHAVTTGGATRTVLAGETAELARVRPRTDGALAEAARASGGGVFALVQGVPAVRRVGADARAAGGGWLGLREPRGGQLLAVTTRPLIPGWASLALLAGLAALAWWKERG